MLNDAYAWLLLSGVSLVNESWYSAVFPSYHDVLVDFYSRTFGMVFVHAAGNSEDVQNVAFNSIVVGSVVSPLAVYSGAPWTADEFQMSPFSASRNPAGGFYGFEVEKPNLVAEGDGHTPFDDPIGFSDGTGAHVADPMQVDGWTANIGTSFSAPVVAGAIAMWKEAWGGRGHSATFRSILGSGMNSHRLESDPCLDGPDPLYPTSVYLQGTNEVHCDYKAGWGPLDCTSISFIVGGGAPGDPVGGDDSEQSGGLVPAQFDEFDPEFFVSFEFDMSSNATLGTESQGLRVRDAVPVARGLKSFPGALSGTRIRATFSYYSCPGYGSDGQYDYGVPDDLKPNAFYTLLDLAPAVNFDLALCGITSENVKNCVWVSESELDTNEGFDVVLAEDYDELDVWLLAPSGWEPCPLSPSEPWSFSYTIDDPSGG